jgi:hypothetical protein
MKPNLDEKFEALAVGFFIGNESSEVIQSR